MPLIGRVLTRNQESAGAHTPVHDVQEHLRGVGSHLPKPQVIDHQQSGLGQGQLQFGQGTI